MKDHPDDEEQQDQPKSTTTTTSTTAQEEEEPSSSLSSKRKDKGTEEVEVGGGQEKEKSKSPPPQAGGSKKSIPTTTSIEDTPPANPSSSSTRRPSSSGVERRTSVENPSSSSAAATPSGRTRFGFLDFDSSSSGNSSGSGRPALSAFNMIQEWARNSVAVNIPLLTAASANSSSSNNAAEDSPSSASWTPNNGTRLQRQSSSSGGDVHINIPPPPPGGPESHPPQQSLSSLPSRLARGIIQSSQFIRSRASGGGGGGGGTPQESRESDGADIAFLSERDRETAPVLLRVGGRQNSLSGPSPSCPMSTSSRNRLSLDLQPTSITIPTTTNNNDESTGGNNNNNNRTEDNTTTGGGDTTNDDGATRRSSGGAAPGSGTGTPTAAPGETAEEEGTPNGDITPETRAILEEINQYTTLRPFLIIMLLKSLVDHGSGIVCFLALFVTFSHGNSLLKKEIAKQRKRNLLFLAMIVVNLLGCAGFIYYVFSEEELYQALGFMATRVEVNSFLMLMWVVGVTDYIAKFGAIVAKAFVVAMPTALVPFQKRGIYYLFIEQSSQLYRSALPFHPWLLYLVTSYEGSMRMFGFILAVLYTIFKLLDSIQRVKDWHTAFRKLFQNVHYGTSVTSKELDAMDSVICPICHDTFSSPTRLSCSHVFCEECVSTWFDRGMTCPMCRAKVVDDPSFRDGTTAQYVQFF